MSNSADETVRDFSGPLATEILGALRSIQQDHRLLTTTIDGIAGRVNLLAGIKQVQDGAREEEGRFDSSTAVTPENSTALDRDVTVGLPGPSTLPDLLDASKENESQQEASNPIANRRSSTTSRIILTTYPGQAGIDPIILNWGHKDPAQRGPVVVTRSQSTLRRRNGMRFFKIYMSPLSLWRLVDRLRKPLLVAIGAHGGSYSIYHALAVASNNLDVDHRPDFTDTEPAASLGPFPQWADSKKIVSMDPLGHLAPWLFRDFIDQENVDIRPTIAITKAHMKLPELEQSVKLGRLVPDGKICLNGSGELAVTKFAIEPCWFLPGVAERFGIDEGVLRRSLFENTGGSFPELITRGDIKVFLPPIGGLTVYCFGDPAKMSDPSSRLALRVHDECNGSDVFGSDICTCRPYLIFGVEEAVKEAQNGGSGVVIYFRKEGRALGEVTKYLVYNARKRGTDRASEYFKRTENIAGVKDMRFQALMPDVLHWLGITKIDRMLSMSNMKYEAIVDQGIPIHERVELPDELIPADSRVEIDAKIHAGYFTTGKVMDMSELSNIQGRAWDDVDVSSYARLGPSSAMLTTEPHEIALAERFHGDWSLAHVDQLALTGTVTRVWIRFDTSQ
ncbi:MAG: putative GTP cyclohydrolase [Candelaria pacifica]|nr:MAG: putative GTP cyclohydrolase [Candelaria pacifica]